MRINDRYASLIENITPALKKLEFTRSSKRFYWYNSSNWGLVDFQKSTKSTTDKIIFTVNLGVASGRLLKIFSSNPKDRKPDIWDCQWRIRLGHLVEQKDVWWSIDNETSLEQLSLQIQEYVLRLGVPEIKTYITDEALRDLWLSGKSPALSKIERLKYLLVLVKDLGPHNLSTSINAELEKELQTTY